MRYVSTLTRSVLLPTLLLALVGTSLGGDETPLTVRYIGAGMMEPGGRVLIPLIGTGLSRDLTVYLQQGKVIRPALFDRRSYNLFEFRAQTYAHDLGYWDIIVERGEERVALLGAIRLVENVVRTCYDEFVATGGEVEPGIVEITIHPFASPFAFPPGAYAASPDELIDCSQDLLDVFKEFDVYEVRNIFPGADRIKYCMVLFPTDVEVIDVVVALDDVWDILYADWLVPAIPCDGAATERCTWGAIKVMYR